MNVIKKCIVTGGLGFIGSHLVDHLLNLGHEVVVLDNEATGRKANLEEHRSNPRLTILHHDISQPPTDTSFLKGTTHFFHLAALADIVPSIEQPVRYYQTNVTGTMCALEMARQCSLEKFIYVASSSCYGIPDVYPTPETAPIKPQYPYALTKNLGEQIALHWAKVYHLPVVALRFFNVFGPRSRTTGAYGAVFGVFLAQKLAGKPLTIVGDGSQTRDFTYVTDVVDAMVAMSQSDVVGDVFNVGSGRSVSVNHLADLLGGERVYIPKRPGEPDSTFADITKISKRIGWKPKVAFEDGVGQMLGRISDWKSAPIWTPETIDDATKSWFRYLSTEKK